MTGPDRRGRPQDDLRERLETCIEAVLSEWDLTTYDVVGVLTCMAHTYMADCDCEDDTI